MIKLIGENGFGKGLKDSSATSSRTLLSAGGVVPNYRQTTCKNEV